MKTMQRRDLLNIFEARLQMTAWTKLYRLYISRQFSFPTDWFIQKQIKQKTSGHIAWTEACQ